MPPRHAYLPLMPRRRHAGFTSLCRHERSFAHRYARPLYARRPFICLIFDAYFTTPSC